MKEIQGTRLTRREFLGKAVVVTAGLVATAAGLDNFFKVTRERDRARDEADAFSQLAAEEGEKRKVLNSTLNEQTEKRKEGLTRETQNYLKECDTGLWLMRV